MARVTHAAPHLPIAEVKNRMRTDQSATSRHGFLIIYNALVEPRRASEIARHCGVSKARCSCGDLPLPAVSASRRLKLQEKGVGDESHSRWKKRRNSWPPFLRKPSVGRLLQWSRSGKLTPNASETPVDDSTIDRLLHRHGWRKVMPRPRHSKSDLETQEQFKKTDPSLVEAAVATKEAGDERPVLILAQDEGCFGRISQVKRAWAPPGMRPHVPVQVVREYMYVYAAVAPAQGQMVSLILPETSTAMMNLELSHVSRSFPEHCMVMQVGLCGVASLPGVIHRSRISV